jgi:hypothetical protein
LYDNDVWTAEIGKNGYTGVYKQISYDTHDTSYFIVSKTNVGSVYRDFKKKILNDNKTFQDVVNDPSYSFAKYIAVRNAERLAYSTAKTLGVGISTIPDSNAFTELSYIARPFKAVPVNGCCVLFSTLAPTSFKGKPCIGLFNSVTPSTKVSDEHFVNAGPLNGITVFNMHSDAVGRAIPLTTKMLSTSDQSSSPSMNKKMKDCIVYEGKKLPIFPIQSKVNNEFLKEMTKMGWKQEGVDNRKSFIPVLVKISNPKIKK